MSRSLPAWLGALALVVGALLPSQVAWAGSCGSDCHTVCAEGCDFPSPAACALGAADADTCLVSGGRYTDTVTYSTNPLILRRDLHFICEDPVGSPCVIDGDGVRANGFKGYTGWQIEGFVVVAGVYGLRKVNDHDAIIDIQHVVGGKIGVNAMLDQEDFNVVQDLLVDRRHFAGIQRYVDQYRCRLVNVSKILHQDHRPHSFDRLGNIGARLMENGHCSHLVSDPRAEFVQPSTFGLLPKRSQRASIGPCSTFSALLIYGITFKASPFHRPIDLGRNELAAKRFVSATAIDDGFFPRFDGTDDFLDQSIFNQGTQVRKQRLFDGLLVPFRRSCASKLLFHWINVFEALVSHEVAVSAKNAWAFLSQSMISIC